MSKQYSCILASVWVALVGQFCIGCFQFVLKRSVAWKYLKFLCSFLYYWVLATPEELLQKASTGLSAHWPFFSVIFKSTEITENRSKAGISHICVKFLGLREVKNHFHWRVRRLPPGGTFRSLIESLCEKLPAFIHPLYETHGFKHQCYILSYDISFPGLENPRAHSHSSKNYRII